MMLSWANELDKELLYVLFACLEVLLGKRRELSKSRIVVVHLNESVLARWF